MAPCSPSSYRRRGQRRQDQGLLRRQSPAHFTPGALRRLKEDETRLPARPASQRRSHLKGWGFSSRAWEDASKVGRQLSSSRAGACRSHPADRQGKTRLPVQHGPCRRLVQSTPEAIPESRRKYCSGSSVPRIQISHPARPGVSRRAGLAQEAGRTPAAPAPAGRTSASVSGLAGAPPTIWTGVQAQPGQTAGPGAPNPWLQGRTRLGRFIHSPVTCRASKLGLTRECRHPSGRPPSARSRLRTRTSLSAGSVVQAYRRRPWTGRSCKTRQAV